jgi:hypothetical protein
MPVRVRALPQVMVCGPDVMLEAICGRKIPGSPPAQGEVSGLLKKLNYTSEHVFKF